MNPVTRFASISLAALTLSACGAALHVTSYTEREADWTRYRTYTWATVDNRPTGDPRLDNNSIVHERMQAAVERELTRRGFSKVSTDADMTVRYQLSIAEEMEYETVDPVTGYCPNNDCAVYVFQSGTIVFALTDAHTNRPVWTGQATGTVDGAVTNQKRLEEIISDVVARVFEWLPPHSD